MEEKVLVTIMFDDDKCDPMCSYLGEYYSSSESSSCQLYGEILFAKDGVVTRCNTCKEATGWRPKKKLKVVDKPPNVGQFMVVYIYKGEPYSKVYELQSDGTFFSYEDDGTGDKVLTECEEGFEMVPDGVEDMVYLVAE